MLILSMLFICHIFINSCARLIVIICFLFFFFNDTATTEIYTLSLHDALPICWVNKLMGSSMYLLAGNVYNWQVQHNVLHHTYTNIQDHDEDLEAGRVLRFSSWSWKIGRAHV